MCIIKVGPKNRTASIIICNIISLPQMAFEFRLTNLMKTYACLNYLLHTTRSLI